MTIIPHFCAMLYRMQRFREFLALALLALLPFHAFLVTAGTKLILGPGHVPMASLAVWKEALLAVILFIAFLEISGMMLSRKLTPRLRSGQEVESGKWDVVDVLIVALTVLAVIVSILNSTPAEVSANGGQSLARRSLGEWGSILRFAFGFKYDFIPLVAFLVLRRTRWSEKFMVRIENLLLWVAGIVALYGILTFFLPVGFFTKLGYSESHSLYLPNGPIAAFQHISGSGIRRIQSTFNGPNQFGMWLLIPLSIASLNIFRAKGTTYRELRTIVPVLVLLLALFFTFSRSAWIAAFVIGCVSAWRIAPKKFFVYGVGSFLIFAIGMSLLFPPVFIRRISLIGHVARPLQAVRMMMEHPMGLGLGSAGPAANRTSDSCVFLEPGSDPAWARANAGLCVFVGDEQVQPSDRRCDCPLLTENWYLQIGVELGVLGFLLYVGLILLILRRLCAAESGKCTNGRRVLPASPALPQPAGEGGSGVEGSTFLFFLGISVTALFLHAWEDGAVAYTAWILAAAALSRQNLIQDRRN